MKNTNSPLALAPSLTRAASKQTYYTVRFLVDRERVADAYRAYAYFRWVDDTLDSDLALSGGLSSPCSLGVHLHDLLSKSHAHRPGVRCQGVQVSKPEAEAQERGAFLARQKSLLETCYRRASIQDATPEEQMLIELVGHDQEKNSGLQSYLRNMMQVMEFDAKRRGRLISQVELNEYTRWLASAVTEAMHYFIGQRCYAPRPHDETRYFAVTGAHITHILRDTFDDVQAGYFNIPREVLEANHIQPQDIHSQAYRDWVRNRVKLARSYFQAGRGYLARVKNPRCRLAGFAYSARFEWLLDTIEQEDYFLRPEYTERKSLATGLRMGLSTLWAWIDAGRRETRTHPVVSGSLREL